MVQEAPWGGGIGGHLIDRKRSNDGSWFDRNKGAIIGSIGGGLAGAGLGYHVGNIKINNRIRDEEKVREHMRKYDKNSEDVLDIASPLLPDKNLARESLSTLREKALEDAKKTYMSDTRYKMNPLDMQGAGVLTSGLASAGYIASNYMKDRSQKTRKQSLTYTDRGTLAGAGMGLVGGFIAGSHYDSRLDDTPEYEKASWFERNKGKLIGSAVGAAGGALMGRHYGSKVDKKYNKDISLNKEWNDYQRKSPEWKKEYETSQAAYFRNTLSNMNPSKAEEFYNGQLDRINSDFLDRNKKLDDSLRLRNGVSKDLADKEYFSNLKHMGNISLLSTAGGSIAMSALASKSKKKKKRK